MKDSPCVTCPERDTCGGKACPDWKSWFHEIWSGLRQKYLGIAPEEATDGK